MNSQNSNMKPFNQAGESEPIFQSSLWNLKAKLDNTQPLHQSTSPNEENIWITVDMRSQAGAFDQNEHIFLLKKLNQLDTLSPTQFSPESPNGAKASREEFLAKKILSNALKIKQYVKRIQKNFKNMSIQDKENVMANMISWKKRFENLNRK